MSITLPFFHLSITRCDLMIHLGNCELFYARGEGWSWSKIQPQGKGD